MTLPEGGGASRSTDPAAGTSSATDVSLREYLSSRVDALDRLIQSQRTDDQTALDKALDAAKELAGKHNDLLRQMDRKDATYATKADIDRLTAWQSRLTGGLLVVGFIGVANLVKLWAG